MPGGSSSKQGRPEAGGLSPARERFVQEYVADPTDAKAAYIRAGFTARGNAAEVNACRLLRNPKVRAEISRRLAALRSKAEEVTGITLQRTLREIARIAFFDPRKMFDSGGNPLSVTDLDNDTAAAIAGLDVLEEFEGAGDARRFVGYVKKYKIAEKKGALDMLMKHLGGYEKDNNQQGGMLGALLSQMGRSAVPVVASPPDDDDEG